jgi:hypothetical protein
MDDIRHFLLIVHACRCFPHEEKEYDSFSPRRWTSPHRDPPSGLEGEWDERPHSCARARDDYSDSGRKAQQTHHHHSDRLSVETASRFRPHTAARYGTRTPLVDNRRVRPYVYLRFSLPVDNKCGMRTSP